MGNQSPSASQEQTLDSVEEAILAAEEEGTGRPVVLSTDSGLLKTIIAAPNGSYLTDALESVGTDEERVSLYAEDQNGNLEEVQAEELGTGLGGTETAIVTYVAQSLASVANDQLRADIENNNADLLESSDQPLDVSASEVDVDINSQTLGQVATNLSQIGGTAQSGVDVANLIDQIEDALKSTDTDSLVTTGASRDEETDTQSGNDVNASTYSYQFDVTEEMDSVTVAVDGASGAFHVEVAFQDGNGTDIVVRDDGNSSAYAGDASTDAFVDVELAAPQCEVRVVDDSGGSNPVDISLRAN